MLTKMKKPPHFGTPAVVTPPGPASGCFSTVNITWFTYEFPYLTRVSSLEYKMNCYSCFKTVFNKILWRRGGRRKGKGGVLLCFSTILMVLISALNLPDAGERFLCYSTDLKWLWDCIELTTFTFFNHPFAQWEVNVFYLSEQILKFKHLQIIMTF